MFLKGKSSPDSKAQKDQGPSSAKGKAGKRGFSILGPSLKIQGDIVAEETFHLDGTLEGTLVCDSLVVGAQGRFKGTLRAREARVAGSVEGALYVGKLIADAGASIFGEVSYTELVVAAGARVEGSVQYAAAFDAEAASEKRATPTLKTVS
jgi:cytoskeletal protein CcmA (bactofilin family)